KVGDDLIGNHTRAKVVKNKVAPPFREAEFDIMYGTGISKEGELVDLGAKLGLVEKSGSWYAMGDVRLGQGRDAAKQYMADHPDVAENLEAQIRANAYKLMSRQSVVAAEAAGRTFGAAAPGEGISGNATAPMTSASGDEDLDVTAEDFEG
ncbi:MAG: DNA recombination/repair protein RecA, partial [Candidatus Onthomonas sp.]